jgi:hypothetical protein
MGLIRFAIRQCAARAILGQTLAEGRVFQSVIDPISSKITSERAPVVIVNTDDHGQDGEGRDITGGEVSLDLVFEAAIAAKVLTTGQNDDGDIVQVSILEADAGLDLTLDMIEHQITRALLGPGEWADLFRRFVPVVRRRISRRGADAAGTRWAARQIVITCDTLGEPVGSEIPTAGVWADFLAAMDADEHLVHIAPLIRATLAGGAADWQRSAAMLGIGHDVAESLGFSPAVLDGDGSPVLIEEVSLTEGAAE